MALIRLSPVWGHLQPQPPVRRADSLKDGVLYWIATGPQRGGVFLYRSGRRYDIPSETEYVNLFAGRPLYPIMGVLAASLSRGSALRSDSDLARKLVLSQNIDTIREALCCDLTGSGYEIGAADRPTRLPDHCAVTYVDKFTYEEAADGSFIGKSPDHFVPVTIFESIEKLDSIANESADFFIACHVIEHVTDVIGGLCEMYRKLVIGGKIVLAVPDSRYIFDSGRPVTTLEHFVADHIETRHSDLDHYLEYFRRAAHDKNWIDVALEGYGRNRDIHRHVFTPESMRELMAHVRSELDFEYVEVIEPVHMPEVAEFFVRLTK